MDPAMPASRAADASRVVVTGASGFIGRHVVSRLGRSQHAVVAASRRPPPQSEGVEWRRSPDLGDSADWSDVLADADVVVHAAARVHVMDEAARDPLAEFRRVNTAGTAALARQAAAAGVRRFIFISSVKVNGETTTGRRPFSPRDEPAPADPYGVSKWEAEGLLGRIGVETAMEVASIRPVLVHGPGVKGNMAIMARIVAHGWPIPLGAVRNSRSLVGVHNLADLIARAVSFPGPLPTVMMVRDDESPSTAELLRRLSAAGGHASRLIAVPPALFRLGAGLLGRSAWADRLVGSLQVDDRDTRDALRWTPPTSLDEGLARMLASEPTR